MSSVICERCGAPRGAHSGTCAYCGALLGGPEIIAAPRFAADGGWRVPSRLPATVGIALADRGDEVTASLASEAELGDAIVPVAWAEGSFVDVDVEATIHFELTAPRSSAGFWLRATEDAALSIMLTPSGHLTVAAREGGSFHAALASAVASSSASDRGRALRVRLRGERVEVFVDGRPLVSTAYLRDEPGRVELRVEVGEAPTRVRLSRACARLAG